MEFYVPPIHKMLEQVCWVGAGGCVVAMIVSMPWVGPGKLIPSMLWLSYSIGGILFFGFFAVVIRVVFSPIGREYDEQMTRQIEGGK